MSKQVRRFDVGNIRSAQRTPQGFLRAPAYATRVGVFKYKLPDGNVRREYRPAEEVFKQDSMQTLQGIPLTNTHPKELLNPKNTKDNAVGFTGDTVEPDGNFVMVPGITIYDDKTIKEVESGMKRELSCGYTCDLENSPGVYEGESYDCVQRNIIYNHLAIVGKGRAGPEARIHLDAADAVMVTNPDPKEDDMEKVKIGGVDHEMHPEAAKAVQDMMKAHDDERKALSQKLEATEKEYYNFQNNPAVKDAMKKDNEAQKNQLNSLSKGKPTEEEETKEATAKREAEMKEKTDALETELKSVKSSLPKLVKERMRVESAARAVGLKKFDDMSDLEIKKAVIAAKVKNADLKDKTEPYIEARFDAITETLQGSSVSQVTSALLTPPGARPGSSVHMDAEVPNSSEVRAKRMDEDQKAWQQPLSTSRDEVVGRRKINRPASH